MAGQLTCTCGHPQDQHTEADGCTRQMRPVTAEQYARSEGICDCAAFVARSGEAPSDAASATRDAPERAPQRNVATRERLPDARASITKVFRLRRGVPEVASELCEACVTKLEAQAKEPARFYFTASSYVDGRPAEVFVRADKTGTSERGLMDAVALLISLLLQHGVPLETITKHLKGTKFPPASFTGDGQIPSCSSPLDLLARWLEDKFLAGDRT